MYTRGDLLMRGVLLASPLAPPMLRTVVLIATTTQMSLAEVARLQSIVNISSSFAEVR